MIDITTEHLVPLADVPRYLPARRSGKRIHISACYRWASRGVHGVTLETAKIGGTTYTSLEALQRMANRLGAAADAKWHEAPSPSKSRQREIEQAAREARAIFEKASRQKQQNSALVEPTFPDKEKL